MPDVDLVIRTAGEFRISNFMLWQIAYSEFYIASVLWPDFDTKELDKALASYSERTRRLGGMGKNNSFLKVNNVMMFLKMRSFIA